MSHRRASRHGRAHRRAIPPPRVNGAAPLTFNAPPGGTTVVNNRARVSMTPLRGGTSLFFTWTEKGTSNANGVVVWAFSASDFSCSRYTPVLASQRWLGRLCVHPARGGCTR